MGCAENLEQLRRSLAMLTPGQPAYLRREDALDMLEELREVRRRLDHLLGELARIVEQGR